ncbi:hypothetical protein CHH75_15570 [Paenibacillus sp. 7541]|nr:hypothetical protein CHH75_15570 [Paenibacillus sp. 7541]
MDEKCKITRLHFGSDRGLYCSLFLAVSQVGTAPPDQGWGCLRSRAGRVEPDSGQPLLYSPPSIAWRSILYLRLAWHGFTLRLPRFIFSLRLALHILRLRRTRYRLRFLLRRRRLCSSECAGGLAATPVSGDRASPGPGISGDSGGPAGPGGPGGITGGAPGGPGGTGGAGGTGGNMLHVSGIYTDAGGKD